MPTVPAVVAFSADGKTAAVPAEHRSGYISIDLQECGAGWRTRLELPTLTGFPCPVAFSPDGLLFVMGDHDGAVRIFDAHTGRLLRRLEGHCTRVKTLVFSHDGRKFATTSEDTTALIWDITDLLRSARGKAVELSATALQSLWDDLAAVDASHAYRAIGRLAQGGKRILPCLRKRLLPVPPVDPQRLAQLVADLDDDRFTVREKATAQLKELGESAVPALRKAIADRPSLELRRRAESLVKRAEELSDAKLRILRCVEVVEAIGGTDAEALLREWARGAAEASLSREAKAALERLARRRGPKP